MFLNPDPYEVALLVIGLGMLASAWLPQLLFHRGATLAVVPLVLGAGLFTGYDYLLPDPLDDFGRVVWEKLTEAVVVVSLVGVGLRLNRRGWKHWSATARLLLLTMPLTIIAVAALGYWAGLPLAAAILLGAALSPTDPVLASDVQVEATHEEEHDVRFALTSEAGINDGLAFPFTYLAIAVAAAGSFGAGLAWEWLWWDLLARCSIAVVVGGAVGWMIGKLLYRAPSETALASAGTGSLALSLFFVAYGASEILHGYGFIAAFVAAMVTRRENYNHKFNETLSDFASNLEHALVAVMLVLLGGLMVRFYGDLTWPLVGIGCALVFVVRPVVGWVSLLRHPFPRHHRLLIAAFGVRGIGTIYYLAYAAGAADFGDIRPLWALCLFVLAVSAVVHGLGATPALRWMKRRDERMGLGGGESVKDDEPAPLVG